MTERQLAQHHPDRRRGFDRNEVTEIIALHECGGLDDIEFSSSAAFRTRAHVVLAPELDDLLDTDNLPALQLAPPSDSTANPQADQSLTADTDVIDISVPARSGQHRKPPTSAAKSRLLITAMAAGATATAAHTAVHHSHTAAPQMVLAAHVSAPNAGSAITPQRGIQVVSVKPASHVAVHNAQLIRAVSFAEERAQREALLQRPLFIMPTNGVFTSGFGYRWGVLHAGIDIANAIGTPIYAVSDGVVIEAGPAAGYGMLVKLRHSDGTATLYGHVNTTMVTVGQRVMAGDQIATMGNRGDSTGPHLHFEVLVDNAHRVDPVPWLAQRGISVGNYVG
ncbi:MAG: M23 family metallopeptidase [Mycobacteriaceae bacterium]|nr:M23 family metallopeptidase [Mycobacteriaceae bacterium]